MNLNSQNWFHLPTKFCQITLNDGVVQISVINCLNLWFKSIELSTQVTNYEFFDNHFENLKFGPNLILI